MALRELFDQVAQGVEEDANLMAEHIVQLGGMAEGTAQAVARRTALDAYRLASADGNSHIDALTATLRQRAGERTEGCRYRRSLHRDRPRHRHLALVRPDEPASRQLSGERWHLTLGITLRRYTEKERMAFLPGPAGLQGDRKHGERSICSNERTRS